MNDSEFDAYIDNIQEQIFDEAKEALGEKGFERWRNPKFCGVLQNHHGYARLTGECGDSMEMYLRVNGEQVTSVSYVTDGCSSSSIAGSFAAELAMGKSYPEVLDLRGADVLDCIGCLPTNEEHCAHLAIRTLQEALNTLLIKQVGGKIS